MPVRTVIPFPLKLIYTAFVTVLIPVYWRHYGPTNFLYFCDMALILTLIGMWTESAFLLSMCAIGILAPQAIWVLDFLGNLVTIPLTGMTDYMFNTSSPLFLRGLSLFHGWLPFLIAYLVWKTGYDRRGLIGWSALAIVALFICYFFMPGPRPDPGMTPVNINYVYGISDTAAQTWMPGWVWFTLLAVGLPLLCFLPTHWILCRFWPAEAELRLDQPPNA